MNDHSRKTYLTLFTFLMIFTIAFGGQSHEHRCALIISSRGGSKAGINDQWRGERRQSTNRDVKESKSTEVKYKTRLKKSIRKGGSIHKYATISEAVDAFGGIAKSGDEVEQRIHAMDGFTLTAYSLSEQSTGKKPTSPGYGVTYSGTHALVGRTVAVDPKVIPIGTPVYIDGIGWRLAEDVGGAVRGKHIDVLMESDDVCMQFGVKRHVRVYPLMEYLPQ